MQIVKNMQIPIIVTFVTMVECFGDDLSTEDMVDGLNLAIIYRTPEDIFDFNCCSGSNFV